ncbi:MAG TPA: FtsX-like permease family protein [Actinomycetota bacterium]
MGAVWMRVRSELRSRFPAAVTLAVLVGLMGGVVIAAAAGARRTETAYPRFVRAQHGLDLVVNPFGKDRRPAFGEVERLPQVVQYSIVTITALGVRTASGATLSFPDVFPIVSPDGRFGTTLNTLKMLSGRRANPSRPDEAVASSTVAQRLHLEPGDRVQLGIFGGRFGSAPPPGQRPPRIPLTVVGVGAAPGEFEPVSGGYLAGFHLTPAFYRAHKSLFSESDAAVAVRLRHGTADVPAFRRELDALHERLRVSFEFPFKQVQQTAGVQSATKAQAIALWVLAILLVVAGLAIFGQSLARHTFLESTEYPTLRALGMSPRQLFAVGVVRVAGIGLVGAAIAAGVGILLSPLTPTGLARLAEPHPGFAVDAMAVAAGAAAIAVLVALVGAIPVWRAARARGTGLGVLEAGARRPSALAELLARLGRAPSAVTGVRMALEPGRGRTAVPVRTTMLGTTLGLFALAAALSFGASLQHLTTTPALSGWNWDALVGIDLNGEASSAESEASERKVIAFLSDDPRVEGYAVGTLPEVTVNGNLVLSIAMESRKGSVTPSLAEGSLPSSPDEIALGSETMRSAGVGIGGTVRVRERGTTTTMRVVGRVAMPNLFFSFARPGDGAVVSLDWVRQVDPHSAGETAEFVRFAPGVEGGKVIAELSRTVPFFFDLPLVQSQRVANLGDVRGVPIALAGIVALLAAATLAHTLVTSVRRRRRDLAILKTIGFSRRQVSATVAWQATTLAVIAVAVGIPLGAVAGRWGWNFFAGQLGVVPVAIVPIIAVLLIVPATLAVANAMAAIPGRVAARTRPAEVLRSE